MASHERKKNDQRKRIVAEASSSPPTLGEGYVTRTELAQYLGVSVSFVDRLIARRAIPCVRLSYKVLRFRREDVARWLEERTHTPSR